MSQQVNRRVYRTSTVTIWMTFVTLAVALTLSGTVLASNGSSNDPNVQWILYEDFSQDALGSEPQGWLVEYREGRGLIEVVAAPELESGRAVRIVGDPVGGETRITKPLDLNGLADVQKIIIEHHFQGIQGRGANLYIIGSKNHLNWNVYPPDKTLGYRSGQSSMRPVQLYEDGWNVIRIVADNVKNEVYVYLNDMENPVGGPFTFREPLESWVGTRLRIQHSHNDNPAEILYGNIKVWAEH